MRRSALVLFMVFGCSGGVSAQETEIAQLNARVRVLEERLAEVEAKLAAVEVRPQGVQGGAPRSSSETTPPATPKPSVAPPGNAAVDRKFATVMCCRTCSCSPD